MARGFEDDWEYSARVHSVLPDAPYVVVPYTMTSRSRDEAASDVEAVFDDLIARYDRRSRFRATVTRPSQQYAPPPPNRSRGPTVWRPGAFSIGSTWIEDWATVFH